MSQFYNDSVFWIEVDKIKPNPYQPRREFDQVALQSLADSIRNYGLMQALMVTRKEVVTADGGMAVEYELIAGERRLRASKLAGIKEVPCLIKNGEENDLLKLELAIIENVQREDLNPVDRARAFQKLADEFGFKHAQIGDKVGKSREYVSNSLRLLSLPEDILQALTEGKITEGHARPLMMLNDRPEEQSTLFKEIVFRKITVREAEIIARKIAVDKVRKKDFGFDPEVAEIEKRFADSLGTRVHIERREVGGKLTIDFFSKDDLKTILDLMTKSKSVSPAGAAAIVAASAAIVGGSSIAAAASTSSSTLENKPIAENVQTNEVVMPQQTIQPDTAIQSEILSHSTPLDIERPQLIQNSVTQEIQTSSIPEPVEPSFAAQTQTQSEDIQPMTSEAPLDDRTPEEVKQEENEDIYSIDNFNI